MLVLLCASLMMAQACRSDGQDGTDREAGTLHPDSIRESLEQAHSSLNRHEEKLIRQYIQRHGWEMVQTPTGLRYVVYRQGRGANAVKGDLVVIRYEARFINDILCHSSAVEGEEIIVVEASEAISGLHELFRYMNEGAKARAIIPSHLAYGFTGDQDKVPMGATLVYDVELLKIKRNSNM